MTLVKVVFRSVKNEVWVIFINRIVGKMYIHIVKIIEIWF
jgi:hypothetical protein